MIDAFFANPAAAAAGAFALVCYATWPLFRSRSMILLMQLGISAGFATHYALLGIWAAAAVNLLGATQSIAAMQARTSYPARIAGYALASVAAPAAGLIFGDGWTTLLCVGATVLICLGRMRSSQLGLRLFILSGSMVWTAHDLIVASWIALAADLISFGIGSFAIVRLAGWKPRLPVLKPGSYVRIRAA